MAVRTSDTGRRADTLVPRPPHTSRKVLRAEERVEERAENWAEAVTEEGRARGHSRRGGQPEGRRRQDDVRGLPGCRLRRAGPAGAARRPRRPGLPDLQPR